MSDETPTAAEFGKMRDEIEELRARVARLEPIASYGDRIVAVFSAFALETGGTLAELVKQVTGQNGRLDTIADRVAMARDAIGPKMTAAPALERVPEPAPAAEDRRAG